MFAPLEVDCVAHDDDVLKAGVADSSYSDRGGVGIAVHNAGAPCGIDQVNDDHSGQVGKE